jgi:hypothetical protein
MKSVLVRKIRSLVVVPAASIVFAGCQSPTGPASLPEGVEIRPTAGSFPVQVVDGRKTVTVSAVVRNESERTIYYSYCTERIAKQEGGEWRSVWGTACASIIVPPEPIEPGESKQFTMKIDDYPDIPSLRLPFTGGGRYRFEVILLVRSGDRFRSIRESASTSFTVTE